MKFLRLLVMIAALSVVFSACGSTASYSSGGNGVAITPAGSSGNSGSSGNQAPSGAEPKWGVQTKTSGCIVHGANQDFACTPGALLATGTKDAICQSGYAGGVRNVPDSEKNQVYAEYGIASRTPGQYEVDHLVSLELGGSNEIANLWPEAASPKPGFHEKDKVENYLHSQVCSGAVALNQAQIEIATNWLAVYNGMPKKSAPDSPTGGSA